MTPRAGLVSLVPGSVCHDINTVRLAAIRASMGHPEPFNLTYVEVGNEVRTTPTYLENDY